ncbi:hypothetical protein [Thalassotalea euphylliae]|uniref:Polymer-forming cytoskeletal protein n=1 Tax=Thalassotalea euphylliae TaxID=1655234 RepID=A0A3E0UEE0_9GAMM|nr:hypothetical protein [Thalassotalea euphylliae]REL35249.1 hypothetical protein DXX92_07695 [Thalassotalea euphylliae]
MKPNLPLFILVLLLFPPFINAKSKECAGEEGYYFVNDRESNPRKGGFVGNGAFVDERAFIAPSASICGSATIEANVRVLGNAVVKDDAYIGEYVRIMGNAIVGGSAHIEGKYKSPVIIRGYARILEGEITEGKYGSNQKPKELIEAETKAANAKKIKTLVKDINRTLQYLDGTHRVNNNEYYQTINFPTQFFTDNCSIEATNISKYKYNSWRGDSLYSETTYEDVTYHLANSSVDLSISTIFFGRYDAHYTQTFNLKVFKNVNANDPYKNSEYKKFTMWTKNFRHKSTGNYKVLYWNLDVEGVDKPLSHTKKETLKQNLNELARLCEFKLSIKDN